MSANASSTITPEKLERLQYLSDRLEIIDCLTRVARGADRCDREIYLSAFHSDAKIQHPNRQGSPSESIEKGIAFLEEAYFSSCHNILNHTCEIKGDIAYTETYYLFIARNRDQTNRISGGRYLDRLERRSGEWKIASRRLITEYAGIIPPKMVLADEAILKMEISEGFKAPSRTRDDPSYDRPGSAQVPN